LLSWIFFTISRAFDGNALLKVIPRTADPAADDSPYERPLAHPALHQLDRMSITACSLNSSALAKGSCSFL
jgi:hypothetical protein